MLPLFADFAPISPSAQWALVSLLGIALVVVLIWTSLRRQPPIDSELVKLNAAIEGLKTAVAELSETQKSHASHATEIEALQEQVGAMQKQREEDQRANRTYTRETTHEIFEKIDELRDSFNANLKSVENRLGRVDGALEGLTTQINRTRSPLER